MITRDFRKQILQQNVQMDGSINFMTNGDINVYPCPWEDEKQVTGGERVRYRAGIEVDADGRTRVKRYNDGLQGPKHDVLYETPHGAVKITRPLYRSDNGRRRLKDEYVYVTFKFPKKYGLALTKALYEEEADQILSYLKTMNCLSEREQSKHVFDLPSVKTVECNSKEETIWK